MQQSRYSYYHNQKRQLIGHQPGVAAPAWKVNQQARRAPGSQVLPGSKILLSRLPVDVGEDEVEVRIIHVQLDRLPTESGHMYRHCSQKQ